MNDDHEDIIEEAVKIEEIELEPEFKTDEELVEARIKQKGTCFICGRKATHWMFTACRCGLLYGADDVFGLCVNHHRGFVLHLMRKRDNNKIWRKAQKENK